MTVVSRSPAEIGMSLKDVDTPALLIELDAFERNLRRLADAIAPTGVRFRPHAKTHRSPVIALRQMALGAVGVCCQTVGEAETMVLGGVPDVLVSNQVVGSGKLARLAALARQARVRVCADDADNIVAIDKAAASYDVRLDVLVEIDVGNQRCGVAPGRPALELAQQIDAAPALRFAGLQAYHGKSQHIRDFAERRQATKEAVDLTAATVALLKEHGLDCETVGGAGTGTFLSEAESGHYNELQAGSYIFMDADYGRNQKEDGTPFDDFENSLFVYTTVISQAKKGIAIVDAGLKAMSFDSGEPVVADAPEVPYFGPSDEHGRLNMEASNKTFAVGDKVRLIPGHCDPTVNLHDWYIGIRNGRVECIWPVAGRGASA
jgi:3-hydroxy-D-aspartate aldolase